MRWRCSITVPPGRQKKKKYNRSISYSSVKNLFKLGTLILRPIDPLANNSSRKVRLYWTDYNNKERRVVAESLKITNNNNNCSKVIFFLKNVNNEVCIGLKLTWHI